MTSRTSKPERLTRDRVRETLRLAAWQLDLAVKTGLLTRGPDGRFDSEQVERASRSRTWRTKLEGEYRLNAADAASLVGCATRSFPKIAQEHGVHPVETKKTKGGPVKFWRAADVTTIIQSPARSTRQGKTVTVEELADELDCAPRDVVTAAIAIGARVQRCSDGTRTVAASHAQSIRQKFRSHKNTGREIREVESKVTAAVRDRRREPRQVRLHLGPTNSGKTYDALNRLAETGKGVYAAPLRMLAREAFEKLSAMVGEGNVGLLTGEESVNPDAPILCCTAEMAPDNGKTLVLDEAHWAQDEDRGYAWTRLLVGAQYEVIEVAASRGATHFLTHVFAWAPDVEVVEHNRLSTLDYAGDTTIERMPSKTLLVAFSRKGVHALASRLLAAGRSVGVLYGALPPENRAQQISDFIGGRYDILVTTDVIGHGINVPAANVVFAQTDKYDGKEHRPLLLWEAAQVAGRAGRFGLADAGHVYTLTGQEGFTPDRRLVAEAAKAAAGKISDGLDIRDGLLRPKYSDLGNPEAHQLGVAIQAWEQVARQQLADRPEVTPMPAEPLVERFLFAASVMRLRGNTLLSLPWQIDGSTLWQVVTCPVDVESKVFPGFVRSIASGSNKLGPILSDAARTHGFGLEEAEAAAGIARDVMVAARCFPDILGSVYGKAARIEKDAAESIDKFLDEALANSSFGKCEDCGKSCAPHFRFCDRCFHRAAA